MKWRNSCVKSTAKGNWLKGWFSRYSRFSSIMALKRAVFYHFSTRGPYKHHFCNTHFPIGSGRAYLPHSYGYEWQPTCRFTNVNWPFPHKNHFDPEMELVRPSETLVSRYPCIAPSKKCYTNIYVVTSILMYVHAVTNNFSIHKIFMP
jgi:hypothetical protein